MSPCGDSILITSAPRSASKGAAIRPGKVAAQIEYLDAVERPRAMPRRIVGGARCKPLRHHCASRAPTLRGQSQVELLRRFAESAANLQQKFSYQLHFGIQIPAFQPPEPFS